MPLFSMSHKFISQLSAHLDFLIKGSETSHTYNMVCWKRVENKLKSQFFCLATGTLVKQQLSLIFIQLQTRLIYYNTDRQSWCFKHLFTLCHLSFTDFHLRPFSRWPNKTHCRLELDWLFGTLAKMQKHNPTPQKSRSEELTKAITRDACAHVSLVTSLSTAECWHLLQELHYDATVWFHVNKQWWSGEGCMLL